MWYIGVKSVEVVSQVNNTGKVRWVAPCHMLTRVNKPNDMSPSAVRTTRLQVIKN